ncbi:MAG: GAF domain-containing protein [Bryobacteraceae bacterium]
MTAKLRAILDELAADSGTVHLIGEDGHLHLAAAIGIPEAVRKIVEVVPVGKGMAGLAAERREPVHVCNIQTDASGDVRPGARATGLEGAIALPMFRGDAVVGVLGVASHRERTFTEIEIARLLALGRELGA